MDLSGEIRRDSGTRIPADLCFWTTHVIASLQRPMYGPLRRTKSTSLSLRQIFFSPQSLLHKKQRYMLYTQMLIHNLSIRDYTFASKINPLFCNAHLHSTKEVRHSCRKALINRKHSSLLLAVKTFTFHVPFTLPWRLKREEASRGQCLHAACRVKG